MELLALFALFIIIMIYSAFSWGYVGYKLYTWFVLPHFPNLPTFTTVHFIGFMLWLFANVMFNRNTTLIKEEIKDNNAMYTSVFLSPWITLIVAWFLKLILM